MKDSTIIVILAGLPLALGAYVTIMVAYPVGVAVFVIAVLALTAAIVRDGEI